MVDLKSAAPAKSGPPPSLKRDALWTAIDTMVSAGLAFLFRLVIARFVVPAEFGVFALALTTFAVVQIINEFGMSATIIQKTEATFTQGVVDTAYVASTIVAVGLFFANLLIIAPLSAWLYGSERVGIVTAVIGISFLFTPTVSISRALLFRKRDYRAVTIARIASTLLSLVAAGIVLALYHNVWALVVQIVSAQIFLAIAMYFVGEWRPRFRFAPDAFREMFGYSGLVFANDAFTAVSKNLDVIVLGRMLTQNQVGLYSLAFYITDVVRMNLASILNRVMFTQYATLQDDMPRVRFYVVRTMSLNALIIFPVMTIIICAGPTLLPYMLGPKWLAMGTTLQLLALSVMLATIGGTTSTVLKAIGRPGLELAISVVTGTLILLPALIVGVTLGGITGAAAAVAVKSLVSVVLRQIIVDRIIGSTTGSLIAATAGAFLALIPMTGIWFAVLTITVEPVPRAIIGVTAQAVAYALTLLAARRIAGTLWPAFDR